MTGFRVLRAALQIPSPTLRGILSVNDGYQSAADHQVSTTAGQRERTFPDILGRATISARSGHTLSVRNSRLTGCFRCGNAISEGN